MQKNVHVEQQIVEIHGSRALATIPVFPVYLSDQRFFGRFILVLNFRIVFIVFRIDQIHLCR
ncbi:hypothetical protein SDC9_95106 [bioreactor metagenome]|uniref:Uncharacterized protein n=1 Tax=bioreactor metagenome TaxID=1076179 RepID=A0A645A5L9_9ZZZZ